MKALIRFKGGCGGNFLKTQLHKHSNQNNTLHISSQNSYYYVESPFRMFQKYTVPLDVCKKYMLPPGIQWYQLSQEMIEEIIQDINPQDDILLIHLVFKKNFNPDPTFNLYELIDMYPTPQGFWITQALQFYKSAFIKERTLPKQYRLNDDKRHTQIVNHFNEHGWYPSYWGWIIESNHDLDDVEGFIERHSNCVKWQHKLDELYMTGREFVIAGEGFVLDTDGTYYTRLAKEFNLQPKQEVYDNFKNYANSNIKVLEDLNLKKHIGTYFTPDQQLDLLKKTFLTIYKDLILK